MSQPLSTANVDLIATGLERDPAGYWKAPTIGEVSYSADGNEFCMSVEDSSFWFAHRNKAIVAAVKRFPPADGPLVDVGAGNGFVSAALIEAGIATIAVEPNPIGAGNAVQRGLRNVICGSFPSSVFLAASAGAIGLFDVVEHVADDREFLAGLRPYLRESGRIYITTPAHQWLWSADDVIAGHQRRYSLDALRATIEAAGFVVDYATYIFAWLPVPLFLMRRRHKTEGFVASRREHTAGGALVRRVLQASLAFETALIRRARRVPLGASCLVVGRLPVKK